MFPASENFVRYAVSIAFAGLTAFLAYWVQRADFVLFITAYGSFFGLYIWLVFWKKNLSGGETRWYTALGIGLRILVLFNIPNFSDDIYRFLWDGRLAVAGYHPFDHPPVYYIENQIFPSGITPELFSKLNSQQYFTVYPPLCQVVFALAAWLSPTGIRGGVVVIKLCLLACEIATIRQLAAGSSHRQGASAGKDALLYAMNPLLILEIVGNGHFEGVMIFFMVTGLRALDRGKTARAAIWWALATAAKLLPLMFLPILFRRMGWRKTRLFAAIFAGALLLLFAPLWQVLPNIFASLDLYFRQFQFNASVYYLFRAIGFGLKGYDIGEGLGPFLGILTIVGVLLLAWKMPAHTREKRLELTDILLFALMLQLGFSATVHPWYATVPLALGILAGRRFPVWWSGLIALSYSHYAGGAFQENYGLIAVEYGVLVWFIRSEFGKCVSSLTG